MSALSDILERMRGGDRTAASELFAHVYGELHRMARAHAQADGYTGALSPTELVHEAYLRLFNNGPPSFADRNYFFAAAAQAMRRVRVDHYRAAKAAKRGGEQQRIQLDPELAAAPDDNIDLLVLDEALNRLAAGDADKAKLVELRFFAGLTMPRCAEILGVSLATAERHWKYVKAWLLAELDGAGPAAS